MNRRSPGSIACLSILALAPAFALAGCASVPPRYFASHAPDERNVVFVAGQPSAERARELRMFVATPDSEGTDGVSGAAGGAAGGAAIAWNDLLRAVEWADIVIVGEQHDDAIGHAVQRALVEDIAKRWPNSALTLEFLERDEQRLIDDYVEGIIDADAFAQLTNSSPEGQKNWRESYQPIVDAALNRQSRSGGMEVIGANAPRRYVRLARTEGYERLRKLPRERRELFDLPQGPAPEQYWERFQAVMMEAAESANAASAQPATQPSTQPASQPASPPIPATAPASGSAKPQAAGHGGEMTHERLVNGFRSQRVWDSTMGASIARAKKSGADKVVHLVGQFHTDFEGGTVHEVRQRLPQAKILIISMQPEDAISLREEDRNRADVVIYTGAPPQEEDAESSEGIEQESASDAGHDPVTAPSHAAPAAAGQLRS